MKKQRQKEGYVYIISNNNYPGFLKIGVTDNIESRLRTYQTASPHRNFRVEYYIFSKDCYAAETKIQEEMKPFALSRKKEWFEISLHMAISRLQELEEVVICEII